MEKTKAEKAIRRHFEWLNEQIEANGYNGIRSEQTAIVDRTLTRCLEFLKEEMIKADLLERPDQCAIQAKEVARIKDDWLKKLGINDRTPSYAYKIQDIPVDHPYLCYRLCISDMPVDELIIDLSMMSSRRRSLRYEDLEIQSIEPVSNAESIEARQLKTGNVVLKDGRKRVVRKDRPIEDGETFVCENPHDDGDMSYICGFEYCRCMQ